MRRLVVCALLLAAAGSVRLDAWGERGHRSINQAAVRAIPDDGPAFLRAHEEWIVYLATIPDSWRSASEPFQKIIEDPNHGWFREQFAFMATASVPRSRYEFVLALDNERRRLVAAGDQQAAALTNVRWTGTLPAAVVLEDPFDAVLAHLDDAGRHVEQVYQLDASGALADAANPDARGLVKRQVTRAAALLRDLAHTAWVRSSERPTFTPADNPTLQAHPHFNPATGSAPAARRTVKP